MKAAGEAGLRITEIHGIAHDRQGNGKSYHEWFVEFEQGPRSEGLRDKSRYQSAQ